jgi:NitT/TauT family transport system substrate-binding protein
VNRNLLVLFMTGLVCACGSRNEPQAPVAANATPAAALLPVKFNMSWLPQGSMVGVIVAIDKGFYAAKGLDVDAVRGFGGIRTTNEIDQGMFDFGYADPVSVVLNRSNGGSTRLVGILNYNWPAGLCFLAEKRQIRSPADLKGLTIGAGQNSPAQALVPRWLERNRVASEDVKMLQLNPSVIVASLVEGKIDAAECWRGNSRPLFAKEAKAAGFTLDWIEYAAHDLDIHGAGIATTDQVIAQKPAVVSGFVAATLQGYRYASENPREARDIMVKRFPQLDPAVTEEQILEMTALVAAAPLPGRADAAKMQRTVEFIAGAYDVAKRPEAADIYTNEFIEAQ